VSILFEVEDLSQASPATVSRAGMIYLNVEDLGWWPYVQSWLQKKQAGGADPVLLETIKVRKELGWVTLPPLERDQSCFWSRELSVLARSGRAHLVKPGRFEALSVKNLAQIIPRMGGPEIMHFSQRADI
jgi:hypothetical protein